MPIVPPTPVGVPRSALPQTARAPASSDLSSMRVHELALQRWFNNQFVITEGYPIPVVFATPKDAFAQFQYLWAAPNNPFAYLYNLKNSDGEPLYLPHPAPVRYPLISVKRLRWSYRKEQSYSIHQWRRVGYPTVGTVGSISKIDLGNVLQTQMPSAWDYRYQCEHYCMHPGSQAQFVQRLMDTFKLSSGGIPETWIRVHYPGNFGTKHYTARMYLDGDIDNATTDEPGDDPVVLRTSFNLTIEGWSPDLDITTVPAFWILVSGTGPVSPDALNTITAEVSTETDLRRVEENSDFDAVVKDEPFIPTPPA